MKKKLMLLFLTISILMMVLVGCSNNSNNIQKNSTNKEKIAVATSGTYYPFTFLEGGELKGFEVDVWNEIGKRLGYDVEFKTASFSGLFGMLESGKVNTIANQITVTPEREEKYYFSEPYVYSGAQIIVKKGNDSIKSFDDLKKVADDIQSKKDDLGIKGAFTSAGMDGSSDWRFKTHLANLPIYYEYKEDGIDDTDAIKGTYLDNYKNVFDLYITDSTCDGSELSAKTADDSRNEFVNGEAVFYQNGSWEYSELSKTFKDDELAMIPIYFGVDDANEGLATGTENYWCVNKNASEADVKATLDFMNWCVTSEAGTKSMAEDMGFTIPFKTAEAPSNVFVKQDAEYTEAGLTPVSWNFTTMPSEEWKNTLGSALTAYAAGSGSWDDVKSAFVDNWATEKALSE